MSWCGRSLTLVADGGDVYYTEYHDESPVQAIVRAISAIEGCAAEDVPKLNKYVEPDSMNRLLERASDSNQDVTVKVTVEDYKVSINSSGTLSIHDYESNADSE